MIPAMPLAATPVAEAGLVVPSAVPVAAPVEAEDTQPFGEALALAVLAAQAQPLPRPAPAAPLPALPLAGGPEGAETVPADAAASNPPGAMAPALAGMPGATDTGTAARGGGAVPAFPGHQAVVTRPAAEPPAATRVLAMLRPVGAPSEPTPPPVATVAGPDTPAPPAEPARPAPPAMATPAVPAEAVEHHPQAGAAPAPLPEVAEPARASRAIEVARMVAALELASARVAADAAPAGAMTVADPGAAAGVDIHAPPPAAAGVAQGLAPRRVRSADRVPAGEPLVADSSEPVTTEAAVPAAGRSGTAPAAAAAEPAAAPARAEPPVAPARAEPVRIGHAVPAQVEPAATRPRASHDGMPGERERAPGEVPDLVGDAAAAAGPPAHHAHAAPPGPAPARATAPGTAEAPADVAGARTAPQPAADQPATAMGQVTRLSVPLHDEGGGQAQLRVSVRGDSVRATIVAADALSARRMEAALGELRQSLAERGYADAKLTVVAPRGAAEAVPAWAPLVAAGPAAAEPGSTPAGQDRSRPDDQQGHRSWTERHSHQRSPRERRKEEQ